jgi:hypothetical protein
MIFSRLTASIKNRWRLRNALVLPPGVTVETRTDPDNPSHVEVRVVLDNDAADHYGHLPVIPGGSNARVVRQAEERGTVWLLRTGSNSATSWSWMTTDHQSAAKSELSAIWHLWHQATRLRNQQARSYSWAPALSRPEYDFRPRINPEEQAT